jgi:4-hydroxy-2-oxoheptanedioate aldolase
MNMNPLSALWARGEGAVGGWCELPSLATTEIMSQAGYDWVCIDWQHGLFGFEHLAGMIQIASTSGAVPVVRVPANEPWLIQKTLDLGAYGVMVPLVNTASDATKAASACRYAPLGVRSYGPVRSADLITTDPSTSNQNVLCIVQIETREAVDNVDEIAAVSGVDALFVGPYDLSLSLGLPLGSPDIDRQLDRVFAASRAQRIPVGRHCDTPADARTAFDSGYALVAVGSDRELLAEGAVRTARAARQAAVRRAMPPGGACRIIVSSQPDPAVDVATPA